MVFNDIWSAACHCLNPISSFSESQSSNRSFATMAGFPGQLLQWGTKQFLRKTYQNPYYPYHKLLLTAYHSGVWSRARLMYRHTDIYPPIWGCCRCIVSAKFCRYISAIFAQKSVALLLYMEHSETQVATSSLTLTD